MQPSPEQPASDLVGFEVILPRFPQYFRTTADPLDVLAYLAGGTLAWIWWSFRGGWRNQSPKPGSEQLQDVETTPRAPARRGGR
jgi:hypothetical protein